MHFGQAFELLKQGHSVRRLNWLYWDRGKLVPALPASGHLSERFGIHAEWGILVDLGHEGLQPWVGIPADFSAEDWVRTSVEPSETLGVVSEIPAESASELMPVDGLSSELPSMTEPDSEGVAVHLIGTHRVSEER